MLPRPPLATVTLLMIAVLPPATFGGKSNPDSSSSAARAYARRLSLPGVPNAGEVTSSLYRGAQPTSDGYRELQQMGVELVIDLRLTGRDKERQQVIASGMQYVSIPWHCYFPRDKVVARFLALLRENKGKKVFVHCRYGDDRTGMMVAAYRMADEGWTPEEARKEMEVFGFHHLVCPALGPYEKHFPEHFAHHDAFKALRSGSLLTKNRDRRKQAP
jgi:tyrosine-protein phosphatase SIW14